MLFGLSGPLTASFEIVARQSGTQGSIAPSLLALAHESFANRESPAIDTQLQTGAGMETKHDRLDALDKPHEFAVDSRP